jgi:hypothetical protein
VQWCAERRVASLRFAGRYDPGLWTDELAFLARPMQADIRSDLYFDARRRVRRRAALTEAASRVAAAAGR